MILPPAPAAYDQANEQQLRQLLQVALTKLQAPGVDINVALGRLLLMDTVTGVRYSLTLTNGVLTATSV